MSFDPFNFLQEYYWVRVLRWTKFLVKRTFFSDGLTRMVWYKLKKKRKKGKNHLHLDITLDVSFLWDSQTAMSDWMHACSWVDHWYVERRLNALHNSATDALPAGWTDLGPRGHEKSPSFYSEKYKNVMQNFMHFTYTLLNAYYLISPMPVNIF